MINLKYIKNQKFNETKLVEILFYAFPLFFIIGNAAVSLHTLLFIVFSFLLIKRKKLTIRFDNTSWLLIIFFLYFFMLTTIQFQSPGILYDRIHAGDWTLENNPIFKSFLLIRFPILIFLIDTLFYNKILNLKKLFLSSLICTTFVSVDIILQYIIGFDIFGNKGLEQWNSGPFGDEVIAGTYLKNFSLISFFYFFKNGENKSYKAIFIILIHLAATFLAGNRMSMVLLLLGCVLIIFLVKNLRFVMSWGLVCFFSVSFLLAQNDIYLKNSYIKLFGEIDFSRLIKKDQNVSTNQNSKAEVTNNTISSDPKKFLFFRGHKEHTKIYLTSILMWKEKPMTGFGFKSFRIKCWDLLNKDNRKKLDTPFFKKFGYEVFINQELACANHSHNYYLEILCEAGIIGIVLIITFFLFVLKRSFIYIKENINGAGSDINLFIPFFTIFLIEIWPIKSTGSFFTTGNATFFWFSTAILLSIIFKKSTKF